MKQNQRKKIKSCMQGKNYVKNYQKDYNKQQNKKMKK